MSFLDEIMDVYTLYMKSKGYDVTKVPHAERRENIERYCTCAYYESDSDGGDPLRHVDDPNCPLHGTNPVHDLPPEFP